MICIYLISPSPQKVYTNCGETYVRRLSSSVKCKDNFKIVANIELEKVNKKFIIEFKKAINKIVELEKENKNLSKLNKSKMIKLNDKIVQLEKVNKKLTDNSILMEWCL